MVEFEKETEMHEPVEAWLRSKGFDNILHEMPCYGKVPDVIAIKNGIVEVTVECKLSDWKKALYQAFTHRIIARRAYVAMPCNKTKLMANNLTEFQHNGIGLIMVSKDGQVKELLPAKENDVKRNNDWLRGTRAYIAPILKKSQYKTLD